MDQVERVSSMPQWLWLEMRDTRTVTNAITRQFVTSVPQLIMIIKHTPLELEHALNPSLFPLSSSCSFFSCSHTLMTSPDDQIFRDVYYCISPSFSSQQKKDLTTLLNTAGGTPLPASASELTHFITTTLPSHQPIDVLPKSSTAHLVTPKWVERSALVGLQDPAYFSPDPSMIFSGVSATATDLSQADIEVLSAGITALGGQWRTGLTKEVTHLFALTTGSLKYETAMHYKEEVGITILVPHWFDDSVRLGIRGLSTAEYEWPEPRVFKVGWGALQAAGGVGGMEGGGIKKEEKKDEDFTEEKRALYDTVLLSPGSTALLSDAPPGNVWNGHKILLSSCLGLTRSQRKAHEADIKREGGVVVEWATKVDELEVVDKADILVTRYRSGPVYVKVTPPFSVQSWVD